MLLLYIYDYEICQYIYFFKTGKKIFGDTLNITKL